MKKNKILGIFFWLIVWLLISLWVNSPIILATPMAVLGKIFELIKTATFWITVGRSLLGIIGGFLLAVLLGSFLASLSYHFNIIYDLFSPLLSIVKSIPVASFIILVLVWIKSAYIATAISFLMVLPVIYFNIYQGYLNVDKNLLVVGEVFNTTKKKIYYYVYLPAIIPQAFVGLQTGIGFAFKSGVAAEVIGLSKNTIGYAIYSAKINLESADLLAWTVVIVILSWIMEKLMKKALLMVQKRITRYDFR